jgi:SAM-dependent methyltransferase
MSRSPFKAVCNRESSSCYNCGSTLRFRGIIHVLLSELFGESRVLNDFPELKTISGIGMSDSALLSRMLKKKFSYTNTFYHKAPFLDIMSIQSDMKNTADFIVCSDVFEHLPPSVEEAFNNIYSILKENGIVIFTVPYNENGSTIEHFPELFDYRIEKKKGKWTMLNLTREGRQQIFSDIVFHGGKGSTLEMRPFSKIDLIESIRKAGFIDIKFHDDNFPGYGIIWGKPDSVVMSMRKPQITESNQ